MEKGSIKYNVKQTKREEKKALEEKKKKKRSKEEVLNTIRIRKLKKITRKSDLKKLLAEVNEIEQDTLNGGRPKSLPAYVIPPSEIVSSEGKIVSYKQAKHWFIRKIEHLPKSEKVLMEIGYKKYRRYIGMKSAMFYTRFTDENALMVRRYERDMIGFYAKMLTPEEVKDALKEMYGVNFSTSTLIMVRNKNANEITKAMNEYQNSYHELRLAHKRSRLEEMTQLYQTLRAQYMKSPSSNVMNSLTQILRAIKDEVEGDLVFNGVLNVNLEAQIEHHFKTEVYRSSNIQELVIAKVANRVGINPLMLLWSVENSYYANKKVGDVEIIYPSDQAYDYDHIEEQYNKRKEERAKSVEVSLRNTEVTDDMAKNFREQLMSKLKVTKGVVKTKQEIMSAIKNVKKKHNIAE